MDLRNGPSVTLYGEDAALVEPFLRDFERKSQVRGTADDEAALRIYAIRQLAGSWLGSAVGTSEVPELDAPIVALQYEWWTTKEAAKALDIGDRGVTKAIAAGRLKGRKVGGAWQVAGWSVVAELERQREKKGA